MDTERVIEAERSIWEGWCTRDLALIERHSSTDYVAVDAEGVFEWPQVAASVPSSRLLSYSFGEVAVKVISPSVVALAFQVHATLAGSTGSQDCRLSVVSIWVLRGEEWLSVLRHEVPIAAQKPRQSAVTPLPQGAA